MSDNLPKPLKYITAPELSKNSNFTIIGNQTAYPVHSDGVTHAIGELTSSRHRISYTLPTITSPELGARHPDMSKINIHSTELGFGIGEPTNLNDSYRHNVTARDWNRWEYVDKNLVQNPDNIVFPDLPPGGVSTRNSYRN